MLNAECSMHDAQHHQTRTCPTAHVAWPARQQPPPRRLSTEGNSSLMTMTTMMIIAAFVSGKAGAMAGRRPSAKITRWAPNRRRALVPALSTNHRSQIPLTDRPTTLLSAARSSSNIAHLIGLASYAVHPSQTLNGCTAAMILGILGPSRHDPIPRALAPDTKKHRPSGPKLPSANNL